MSREYKADEHEINKLKRKLKTGSDKIIREHKDIKRSVESKLNSVLSEYGDCSSISSTVRSIKAILADADGDVRQIESDMDDILSGLEFTIRSTRESQQEINSIIGRLEMPTFDTLDVGRGTSYTNTNSVMLKTPNDVTNDFLASSMIGGALPVALAAGDGVKTPSLLEQSTNITPDINSAEVAKEYLKEVERKNKNLELALGVNKFAECKAQLDNDEQSTIGEKLRGAYDVFSTVGGGALDGLEQGVKLNELGVDKYIPEAINNVINRVNKWVPVNKMFIIDTDKIISGYSISYLNNIREVVTKSMPKWQKNLHLNGNKQYIPSSIKSVITSADDGLIQKGIKNAKSLSGISSALAWGSVVIDTVANAKVNYDESGFSSRFFGDIIGDVSTGAGGIAFAGVGAEIGVIIATGICGTAALPATLTVIASVAGAWVATKIYSTISTYLEPWIKDVATATVDIVKDIGNATIDIAIDMGVATGTIIKDVVNVGIDTVEDIGNAGIDIVGDIGSAGIDIAKDIGNAGMGIVKDIGNSGIDMVKDIGSASMGIITDIGDAGMGIITDIGDAGMGIVKDIGDAGVDIVKDIGVAGVDIVKDIGREAGNIGKNILTGGVDISKDIITGELNIGEVAVDVRKAAGNIGKNILAGSVNIGSDVLAGSVNICSDMLAGSVNIGSDMLAGSVNIGSDVLAGSKNIGSEILAGGKNIGSEMLAGGKNIGKDIMVGTGNVSEKVVAGIEDTCEDVVAGIKDICEDRVVDVINKGKATIDAGEKVLEVSKKIGTTAININKEIVSNVNDIVVNVYNKVNKNKCEEAWMENMLF